MPTPKWLVVAKNEYRIRLSRIRKIRPLFPYLSIGMLAVYVALIAPSIVSLFIDDFLAFILSQVAIAMVPVIMFMIFFYFIILPITYTLKEVQTSQLEIFLAAPIKPSDVLLGEFFGVLPFYAIVVTVIAGFFTALLNLVGLDFVQMAIVIIVIVVTLFSALWIGTVIAAILRTRLGKTARGKDIGRALALVIALPLIAMMYAISGGGLLQALADPGTNSMIRAVLGFLPSSWGAEIIFGFVNNPGNISAVGFETLAMFGGLIAFFIITLWLGARVSDRAYSLETFSFAASVAKPEGRFYKTIKYIGGRKSFGTLLVSIFKDYGRRLENLSKIFYVVGLLFLINIFLVGSDPEAALLMPLFILPFLAVFVVGEATLRGKETLFIFKKTPYGVGRFVKARLVHGLIVVVPITVTITVVSSILSQQNILTLLAITALAILFVSAIVAFILGLSLLNPAFSDKSGNYITNIMITMFVVPNGLFLIPLIVFNLPLLQTLCYFTIPLSWIFGIVFLYLGKGRLTRIE